jgi:predicted P-loop ATPase
VDQPRQCVIVGTINDETYLYDATGNRRFWPFEAGAIKIDDLKRDRDQLLAEAVHLFRADFKWWPSKDFEKKHIAPEQDARFEADVWEPEIRKFLDGDGLSNPPINDTSILEVACGALGYSRDNTTEAGKTALNRLSGREGKRIANVLRHIGFRKAEGKKSNRWERTT